MKIIGGFEDLGEMAQEAGQNIAQQTKKQVQTTAKTASAQITGNQSLPNSSSNPQGTDEQGNSAQQKMSDDQAKQFLKDLYGPSKSQAGDKGLSSQNNPTQSQNIVSQAIGMTPADPNEGKTPEEIAKLDSLKNQLHADYYRTLTDKKPEEERVTEKLEREDQEKKMEELQEEEKKPKTVLPPGTKQGTGENVVGVSG